MAAKFQIRPAKDGQFVFNLKAGNGEVILTSEVYSSKSAAQNGIESVKANASVDGRFERKTSKANQPFFVLKAANGETIGKSEMYSSASAMEGGIASVKKNAASAAIEDNTAAG